MVPLFLLLLFGLLDFARLVFTYVSLSNGAREMARTAAISQTWNNGATAASNHETIVRYGTSVLAPPM